MPPALRLTGTACSADHLRLLRDECPADHLDLLIDRPQIGRQVRVAIFDPPQTHGHLRGDRRQARHHGEISGQVLLEALEHARPVRRGTPAQAQAHRVVDAEVIASVVRYIWLSLCSLMGIPVFS
jgi:hypothetical protein